MSDVAIQFERVSKRFRRGENFDTLRDLVPALIRRALGRGQQRLAASRDFLALKDISLTVRQGETVGVIGHNGAGKSTMLKHLSGIMFPTTGSISVNGRLSALIEVGAGFHPDLTGRENVFLNGVILGMTRAEILRKFDDIVDFAGLAQFIDMPVKRYSSGMFARLGFSVAAHLDPDILVIDEVLSVGDFVFQQKSLEKMRSIARSGATVIFVSHNLKAVSDLCARTVVLDSGSIVADVPTAEAIQRYLEGERAKLETRKDRDVVIRSVTIRNASGPIAMFEPGEEAWVDVTYSANRAAQSVAAVIAVLDEGLGFAFHTSSEHLGIPSADLQPGESRAISFKLHMHLAVGTYHLGVYLHRYDMGREYDRAVPAATFFVSSDAQTHAAGAHLGSANLYPEVISCAGPHVAPRSGA